MVSRDPPGAGGAALGKLSPGAVPVTLAVSAATTLSAATTVSAVVAMSA
ncbi:MULTISPECIES: hypothetical protein [unclassified Streptomyces]